MTKEGKMQKYGYLIAFVCLFMTPELQSFERPWVSTECQQTEWLSDDNLVKGVLTVELRKRCVLSHEGGRYLDLRDYLNEMILESHARIYQGPDEIEYRGLPGVFYDGLLVQEVGGEQAQVRQNVYLATNEQDHLVLETKSTHIEGEGTAGYLRQANSGLFLENRKEVDRYDLSFTVLLAVKKPWYAPEKYFVNKVKESVGDAFETKTLEFRQEIEENF